MAYYRCGPTATIGNRTSWGPVSSPTVDPKSFDRPLSGNFDRIFNVFERTNAFEYVRNNFEGKEERHIAHGDLVVNRKMSSSYERADCALAAQSPILEDEDFYREKILYSQARQLFPLQEDLADWINKTIGTSYLSGDNFLDVLDNGAELCQLAAVIHEKAREALDQGLIVGPVPQIRGRCWQRAARRSFFSRDNTENFITFCRELGVHENLLFESDDLVLHNQPRQVILCLLEVARLATKFNVEPPGLVQLEKEIAMEERDSGLDSAMSGTGWQFRDCSPLPDGNKSTEPPPTTSENRQAQVSILDNADTESTKSGGTVDSTDSDVPLKPTNELDKRVQLVTRLIERGCSCGAGKCSKLLKVKKVGEGRYNIAGRNVFIRLLKGRHMMVRVGGGWDTLEHFLSRHEPCQVRLVTRAAASRPLETPSPVAAPLVARPFTPRSRSGTSSPTDTKPTIGGKRSPVEKRDVDKKSPTETSRRTSLPKPLSRNMRSSLTLPLNSDLVDRGNKSSSSPRNRKQSAPAVFGTNSTPNTPTNISRPTTPRSLNLVARQNRSRSLASTPVVEKQFCGTDRLNTFAKKTRSTSLVGTTFRPVGENVSLALTGPMTRAAIEESVRLSLAATISDESSSKKPFLHIKAKYRSPPPREVPPR